MIRLRRLVFICMVLVTIAPAGMGLQVQEEATPPFMATGPGSVNYAEFNSSELGFAIEYPDDWSVVVNESTSSAAFGSPDRNAVLSVGIGNLSEIRDPSGRPWLTDLNEREEALLLMLFGVMFQPVTQPETNQTESQFVPPQFETMTLDGKDAIAFPVYVDDPESADIEARAILGINADKLYFLIYVSKTEDGMETIREMLDSFRFV